MLRRDAGLAALVDAAIILREVFHLSYAEALLSSGDVPRDVIERVLKGSPSERRIMHWRDSHGSDQIF
ncbi:hypothetical protein OU994_28805 [Pseudoduganella sp. SL102]|uniref:Uncharacterized protein n=1 Tax=Pseudoduganella albidiflava TaxID=321983 RepID=A0A411WSP8_9BURK|nr:MULTISPECIES: hypothetical protein [Pseudoduganella]QBH99799.1 hypothetical protein EYF70_02295 [Pseudoduganella albidiflava]WBS02206.1 hypothetical protein OU994_28805 [Pseudoduganella sp. SL102]GGY63153.1 hypothetical protein GCM10007387_52120 [Pseudoduganella albidiflava]